ncbi:hypothetical protein SAMN05421644_1513 [Allochromatium warmingii]|uniref:Uncharacterized protein n=1 Tax=Allochromatium warmingii TaxID=61595 RepID=A0A1H3J1S9_ALLWA|nr:hypothetical protein SAMN05421644_1513 [Allochromatium warmingii]
MSADLHPKGEKDDWFRIPMRGYESNYGEIEQRRTGVPNPHEGL